MNKNIGIAIGTVLILGACFYGAFLFFRANDPVSTAFDPRNATYTIENEHITLVDGKADTVEISGEVIQGDINQDDVDDAVFFLTQTSEGSGTFFYVAAALNMADGTVGSNAVFLGDRIVPEEIVFVSSRLDGR